MANKMYASEDGLRLGVFEGESNHLLLFDYMPSLDVVEVKIMRGEEVEARFHISVTTISMEGNMRDCWV